MKQLAELMLRTEKVLEAMPREDQLLYAASVWRRWGGDPVALKTRPENTLKHDANTPESTGVSTGVSPTPPVLVVPAVPASSNNGSKQDKHELQDKALEVLNFLNSKAGKRHRPVEENLRFIRARLKNTSVEDCKGVIARKTRQWTGTEHALYLRPKTLFNATNFEQYIGEQGT